MVDGIPWLTLTTVVTVAVTAGCAMGGTPAPASATDPTAAVVMVIRHGEKPDGSDPGIDAKGKKDKSSLTRTGWERAEALVTLFAPAQGRPGLARPLAIYAAGKDDDGNGKRTRETVAPLAEDLGITVDTTYAKGDEQALVEHVIAQPGPTLISWQHEEIPTIAAAFPQVTPTPPTQWPDDRFDVVWVFTRIAGRWHFSQQPELVLPQDTATVIAG